MEQQNLSPSSPRPVLISYICNTIVSPHQVQPASTFTSSHLAGVAVSASSVRLPADFNALIFHLVDDGLGSNIKSSFGAELFDIWCDNGGN